MGRLVMKRNDPRMVALDALIACLEEKRALDDVLERDKRFGALEARDRALVFSITAETCRNLGQIDTLIRACLNRPLPSKEKVTRGILRLGAAQLLFMDLAPHAAVSTSVDLARTRANAMAGFVNAVLRRLGREGRAMMPEQDAPRLNAPDWLFKAWCEDHGAETARAIAEAHGKRAPLDLTVAQDQVGWASKLDARLMPTGGLRRKQSGPITDLPGYGTGGWWVQDAAASLPARLLGDVKGKRVLDFCAAPGGKTAQLVAAGADVTAVDLSEKRLRRLDENMKRLGYAVETVVGDAASWKADAPADAILLDAPCSGTGTIRRHPDIAWTKSPEDPQRLSNLQGRMIANAIDNLKPGGLLVYAVCSLQAIEGEFQLGRILKRRDDVTHMPIDPEEIGGLPELINSAGCLRTLPCHLAEQGGVDGFFAMRLRASGEAGT